VRPPTAGSVALAVLLLAACGSSGDSDTAAALSDHLQDAARDGREANIAEAVDGDWTKLVFICPYEDAEAVTRRLGFEWTEYEPSDNDGEVHWVFADDDQVRTSAVLGRNLGDPCGGTEPAPAVLPREAARFSLRDSGQKSTGGETFYVLQVQR
jgi:hypothetical protein